MQRILQIRSFTFFQNKDDIKYCVGQCYDGAKVMSGWASGVQARVKDQAPHATYFHCHAHRFNLVLVHSLGVVEEAKDFFSTLQTIYCFISNSSPQHELFLEAQRKLKQPILSLERLVPTRWFYWFSAVSKILKTFKAILVVLDEGTKDRAESVGIRTQMEQQCFIFRLCAMELILGITYSLFQQLQSQDLDLMAAGCLIKSTKVELVRIRRDEKYEELVEKAKSLANTERNMKSIYFNILDTIMDEFDRRFSVNQDIMEATRALQKGEVAFLDGEVLKPLINKY